MATYFNNSNNQRDSSSMLYFREPLASSYPEATVVPGNAMMFMNSGSYSDALAGNAQQQSNGITIPSIGASSSNIQQQEVLSSLGGSQIGEHDFNVWRDGRNEMLVMHSVGDPASILHTQKNLQAQGLSLSLSTQIPTGIQVPSFPYQNHNSGFASLLSPNPSVSGEGGDSRNGSSRDEQSMNAEYLPHGVFPGGTQDSSRGDLSPFGMTNVARSVPNSRYLKAAQQLLDEVVNVRKALKQPDTGKNQSAHERQMISSKEAHGASSDPHESSSDIQSELSHAERQDSQNKLTKLLSMLDEVDRRYKQYYHQMQIVVSSFDVIAGCGAAKPYTALALQTISRHFRCMRDAITTQIRTTRKLLGEQDASGNSGGISRLRYVDQHLRQQKALQQLGMIQQHAWRPQRGLPENSVSILRAWLFEHFLHPYPKDSDKIMLARQTGLTRSQVSNWFINARVRLWKPMVEEMYKEEIVDAEMESNSSSDNVARTTKHDNRTSEDRGEEFQQSTSSTATEKYKCNNVPDVEMTGTTGGANADDFSHFQDAIIQSEGANGRFMAAAAAYHMSELGRLERGNGVSLTLGLQHCEGGNLPMSGAPHQSFVTMAGGYNMYNPAASNVDHETAEVESIDPGNRQHRFNSSHLLHDFVA